MELKSALKEQYHAGIAMLAECVEKCPNGLWCAGKPPRFFWRIAFHAAFFTQLYLGPSDAAFEPWPGRRDDSHELWNNPARLEPYELPNDFPPYSQAEMLDYLAFIDGLVDPTLDTLDLDAAGTGFSWYKNMSKLSHALMNLRHIQGHVGQLSELLMAHDIDTNWIAKAKHMRDKAY